MGASFGVVWEVTADSYVAKSASDQHSIQHEEAHGFQAGDLIIMYEDGSVQECPAQFVDLRPGKFLFQHDGHFYAAPSSGFGQLEVLNPLGLALEPGAGIILANGRRIHGLAPDGAVQGPFEPPSPARALAKLRKEANEIADSDCRFAGYEAEAARATRIANQALDPAGTFEAFGFRPPQGLLLLGPPGTGKTTLARKIAKASGARLYIIRGPEVISRFVGDAEKLLRAVFEDAQGQPSVIFFDEIDSLTMKRGKTFQDHNQQLVAQMLSLMDGFAPGSRRLIIGTTNRADDIDEAFRRPGRLDAEIELGTPSQSDREAILTAHLGAHRPPDLSIPGLAAETNRWSGADLYSLVRYAASLAASDGRVALWASDIHHALRHVSQSRRKQVNWRPDSR